MKGLVCRSITPEELEAWCNLGIHGRSRIQQAAVTWRRLWREGVSCPADCWWACEGRRPLSRVALLHEGEELQRIVDLWFDARGPWYRLVQTLLENMLETRPWKPVLWELEEGDHTAARLISLAGELGFRKQDVRRELCLELRAPTADARNELELLPLQPPCDELSSCGLQLEDADCIRQLQLSHVEHPACYLRLDGLGGGELRPAPACWQHPGMDTILLALAAHLPSLGVEVLQLAPSAEWQLSTPGKKVYTIRGERAYLRFVRPVTEPSAEN